MGGYRQFGKDVKGSGRRLIELQSRLCVGTKESIKKLCLIMRWPGKIRSGHLPSTVLACYAVPVPSVW